MKSGSISYSPDYKSEKRKPKYPEMTERFKQLDIRHERLRLEREIVEKCSAYCASVVDMEENGWPKDMTKDEWHNQHLVKQTAMIDAYKALTAFEAEQEKKS